MTQIKSILNTILKDINNSKDEYHIKGIFIERVEKSKIKEIDKRKMVNGIHGKQGYDNTIKYIYNCLLKYEGDGVIKIR